MGLAEVWSFVLEDAQCEVTVVGNGGEALAAASRLEFDVAVLDLQMPDLSGLEVFVALKADRSDIEGIIITGHASMDSAIEAVNRGVFSYLVKPVSPDVLRILVERALERQHLQAENRRMVSHLGALREVLDAALEAVGLADAFQRIAEAVVDAMGVDGVSLLLLDADGCLVPVAAYPFSPEVGPGVRARAGAGGTERVFATRRPQQIRDIRQEKGPIGPQMRSAGIRALLGVPVVLGTDPVGVMHVGSVHERVFGEHEVHLLEAISQRVAMAVEKYRLLEERDEHLRQLEAAYRRERRIAETLQRSFLPAVRLDVPGIEVAHLYQAALDEAKVGGDFYDVIDFGDGHVGLVMGDISGKGLDAAVYTALTKYTLRSYALEDSDPGSVMERLNRAFVHQSGWETFATLFYGVVDLNAGTLTYANAGQEPGLLYDGQSATCKWLRSTGPVAGIFPEAEFETCQTSLGSADILLLYTDGASDARRDDDAWLGTEGLEALLTAHVQKDLQGALAGIYAGILDFAKQGLRDDTALLLLRPLPSAVSSDQ